MIESEAVCAPDVQPWPGAARAEADTRGRAGCSWVGAQAAGSFGVACDGAGVPTLLPQLPLPVARLGQGPRSGEAALKRAHFPLLLC